MMRSKTEDRVAALRAAARAVLALGLGLLGALLAATLALGTLAPLGSQAMAQGTIIYVDVDATGDNNGTSWEDAFADLQDALDAALTGDEIWVAAGSYYPSVEHGGTGERYKSFQMLNGVGIYGGFDPTVGDVDWEDRNWVTNVTILSGDIGVPDDDDDNCYHVFYHPSGTDLDSTAILDGLTITRGRVGGGGDHDDGAGMFNSHSSPTLTNCTFAGNYAVETVNWDGDGGGMYNDESSPTLTNCTFEGNYAVQSGGGMYNWHSSPVLTNCTFEGNRAEWGGGMYNSSSSPMLTNCTFEGNGYSFGGGMSNYSSSPTLTNCTFSDNEADFDGGGMWNSYSSPTLINCTFAGNQAWDFGGGMSNWDSSPTLTTCTFDGNTSSATDVGWAGGGGMDNAGSSPTLTNCTFSGNSAATNGGGMHNHSYSSPALTNCTFSGNSAANSGGGMFNSYGSATLSNCILWEDSPNEISGSATVTYSDIQGGYTGVGNIDADPLWVDPTNGDYHLSAESPCIDAGTNDAPYLPDYDFEGDDRIIDGDGDGAAVVDMGIDEAQTMHVRRIAMRYRERGDGRYLVSALLRIDDGSLAPVEGAVVGAVWTLDGRPPRPQEGVTSADGRAVFRVGSAKTGTYEICVTDVVKEGYLYDPEQNVQTCETVEVP